MVVLALYVLLLAGLWWVWVRTDPGQPSEGTTAPAPPPPGASASPGDPPPPDPRPRARPARRRGADGPPLSEDDVIAFGLALEGTDDVVRRAVTDSRRTRNEPTRGGRA